MKFGSLALAVLAGGLLIVTAAEPVSAGHDKKRCTVISELDKLGARLEHDLFGWLKRSHKR